MYFFPGFDSSKIFEVNASSFFLQNSQGKPGILLQGVFLLLLFFVTLKAHCNGCIDFFCLRSQLMQPFENYVICSAGGVD